jgi:hypothetical protein
VPAGKFRTILNFFTIRVPVGKSSATGAGDALSGNFPSFMSAQIKNMTLPRSPYDPTLIQNCFMQCVFRVLGSVFLSTSMGWYGVEARWVR